MQLFTNLPDLMSAIVNFAMAHGSTLPSGVGPIFSNAASQTSPVDKLIGVAETLYGAQADITDSASQAAAQTLAGQCAAFAAQNDFHGFGSSGRGAGIMQAMQRELGETAPTGLSWPAPAADPIPNAEYVVAAPVTASLSTGLSTSASSVASLSTSAPSGLSTSTSAAASLSTSASTSA